MNTDIIVSDNTPRIAVTPHSDEALERLMPQLEALDPSALSHPNVDPDVAAGRALGAIPAIEALRPRIERECPLVDLPAIDALQDRANALLAAGVRYRTTLVSPEGLTVLASEAMEARTVLASICAMLVSCNLLKHAQVPALTGGHSPRVAASETLTLVGLLKENWPRIQNKVPVSLEQIERLRGVSEEVIRLVNVRDQMPQRTSEAALLRQRALTLVDQAYDEARRVVSFLRWHEGDADEILPPLRTHAGPSKRNARDEGAAGDAGGAGGEDATGGNAASSSAGTGDGTTHPMSAAQIEAAMQMFAPPSDAKPGAGPGANAPRSVPRSKPFSDA